MMRWLIIAALLLTSFKPNDCLKLDIVVVADLSGSVHKHEPFIADAIQSFADKLELSEVGPNMGIIGFSNNVILESSMATDIETLRPAIEAIRSFTGGDGTYLSTALVAAQTKLMNHARPGYRQFIIIISDGIPNDKEASASVAHTIKHLNITVCGILVEHSSSSSEFMQLITSPNYYTETNYSQLGMVLQRLNLCM